MIDERLADHRAAAHHEVEHARRARRRATRISASAQAHAGHQIGRLEHDAVAVGERRRDLPRGDRDREVPRRDEADDADRLARDLDVDARAHRRHALAGERSASPAKNLKICPARIASPMPSGSVLPSSRDSSRPSSSLRARISVPTRRGCSSAPGSSRAPTPGTRPSRRRSPSRACAASACAYSPTTSARSDGLRLTVTDGAGGPLAGDVVPEFGGHRDSLRALLKASIVDATLGSSRRIRPAGLRSAPPHSRHDSSPPGPLRRPKAPFSEDFNAR